MTTTAPTTAPPSTSTGARGPRATDRARHTVHVARLRASLELVQFFRNRAQLVLTLAMPVIMLVLFGLVFGTDPIPGTALDSRQVFATGMLAVGIMSTSFQSLTLQVAQDRTDGALTRLRGLPMPATSYFAGKVAVVLVSSTAQAVVLLGLGSLLMGVHLPTDPGRWLTFAWVFLLGIASCSLLGLAYSSLVTGPSAGVVVFVPFMVLQFTSGVYVPLAQLPGWVRQVTDLFPLAWLARGMRSAFLPDAFAAAEPSGGWEHGHMALVLGFWALAGLALCLRTFRWRPTGA